MNYLTYVPWPGELNNTRMCFETVLVLAYLSRRVLVMPREYRWPHEPESEAGRYRPLYPQECFDLRGLMEIVPILEYEEYEASTTVADRTRRAEMIFEPETSVFCFPKIPNWESPDGRRLVTFAEKRRRFLEFTREMNASRILHIKNPTLEHFYTFVYCSHSADELACKRLIKDHLKFRPEIERLARGIAQSLGRYVALHIRRNDFLHQYPQQNIPATRLLDNLTKRIPAGTRLYIASDEKDRTFFAELRHCYEILFIDDFRDMIPHTTSDTSIACIEQLVCSFGESFVGTKLSTFSGYINRLRGYGGASDANIHFTDGSPGSEMDNIGSPLFSWSNWAGAGNPLWGREFRESWQF